VNGSRAEIYDFDLLMQEEAPQVTTLLRSSDLEGPISAVTVRAHRTTGAKEAPATVYSADIDIDREVAPEDWQAFLAQLADNPDFSDLGETAELISGAQGHTFHFLDPEDQDISLTVEFNPVMPHVTLHTQPENDRSLPLNRSAEAEKSLLILMSSLMHVLDWTSSMYHSTDQPIPLNKLYRLNCSPVADTQRSIGEVVTRAAFRHPELEMLGESVPTLAEIGGHREIKKYLQEIILMQSRPDILAKWGAKLPAGVLIYGHEGTGKTMLINAWAHDMRARVIAIKGTVAGKYIGESAKNMSRLFDEAEAHDRPVIVLCDEIDAISSHGNSDERRAMIGVFKTRAANLRNRNPQAILAATANSLAGIDPAILRSGRFDARFEVGLPDASDRADILSILLRDSGAVEAALAKLTDHGLTDAELAEAWGNPAPNRDVSSEKPSVTDEKPVVSSEFRVFAADIDPDAIAAATKGLTGADLTLVLENLRRQKAIQEISSGRVPAPISQSDILNAAADLRARNKIEPD